MISYGNFAVFYIHPSIQLTNQPTIYFPQYTKTKKWQCEHYKHQRKATREATRLNELVAYVIRYLL